jgi:hypothetical protein
MNSIQAIQVSHSFTPGFIFIREENLNAVTYSTEQNQIIVLVLDSIEDGEDFRQLMLTCDEIVRSQVGEVYIKAELARIYNLSHHVFRAREAVIEKMAHEIADLKNREVDMKNSLRFLFARENNPRLRLLYYLIINGSTPISKLSIELKISENEIRYLVEDMEQNKMVEIVQGIVHLLIHLLL